MAAVQARLLAATSDETAAAADVVTRALAHPLFVRARVAFGDGRCRREVPLTYTAESATLVEGVADLAFEEGGKWIVVDVKTDVEIGRVGLERYKRQVALYAAAVARATSKPVTAALLRV
jgi:ATP-dependent exoDNAse (exonuclease V) beta subunit